jgi:hypothetical protein
VRVCALFAVEKCSGTKVHEQCTSKPWIDGLEETKKADGRVPQKKLVLFTMTGPPAVPTLVRLVGTVSYMDVALWLGLVLML